MYIEERLKYHVPEYTNRYIAGKRYVLAQKVSINRIENEEDETVNIASKVNGTSVYNIYIKYNFYRKFLTYTCSCPDYEKNNHMCKHIIATILEYTDNATLKDLNEDELIDYYKDREKVEEKIFIRRMEEIELHRAEKLLNKYIEGEEAKEQSEAEPKNYPQNGAVKIEPVFKYDSSRSTISCEFKIGTKQMYKIKTLDEFADRMREKEPYKYGAKLSMRHLEEEFTEESKPIIDLIKKYGEHIKYANSNISGYTYATVNRKEIVLEKAEIDSILTKYEEKQIPLNIDDTYLEIVSEIPEVTYDIYKINDNKYEIKSNLQYSSLKPICGELFDYYIASSKIYKVSKKEKHEELKLAMQIQKTFSPSITVNKKLLGVFLGNVLKEPDKYLSKDTLDKIDIENLMPKKLSVKLKLDYSKDADIIMECIYCYGDLEFNPLTEKKEFLRNVAEERKAENVFARTGFNVLDGKYTLTDDEQIYHFLTDEIEEYTRKYEVLVTENFKARTIVQPKIGTIGIKIENNLLSIDLKNFNIKPKEIENIMDAYKKKIRYVRLKDGTFINLEKNENIDFIADITDGMALDTKQIAEGKIKVPMYRSIYLNKILDKVKTSNIEKDKEYIEIVNHIDKNVEDEDIKISKKFNKILRTYQKTGVKWLKTLDEYKFGGILADDMGLGKTLQVISLVSTYLEETKAKRKTTLVVCPSSLSLNWKNELSKFAADITVEIIDGKASERKAKIKKINSVDVAITSYDLLKRDVDLYDELKCSFKYIIADEAQYVKNSNTQNASALKRINAETRFALTGTPVENSLAELWSIFDYIMPGYLFTYAKFKKKFESPIVKDQDSKALAKLRMLIAPFILRRLKKEVLTELPDKTITVIKNEMTEEQKNLYISHLARAKQELADELKVNTINKSKIKILALLTRLRQICCHPSLFLEDYDGESSKLNQCMDLVKEAILSGHKILIFSQFTSMFDIIEKEFNKEHIKYFKLTGQTKVDKRIEMVDEFNESSDVKVFLISLKAGGTGLNLTGADMVIHYDPWWNLSAENQATDRTYRIGQKNNVQVYKCITENSIEEKINELQQKKSKLTEDLLTTEETFITKLSNEDLMKLFD
ncbi:MAG: SNF2 helicase associated domain-containing protein [Clostridia bacterium]